jgi:hypothetical protein
MAGKLHLLFCPKRVIVRDGVAVQLALAKNAFQKDSVLTSSKLLQTAKNVPLASNAFRRAPADLS